MPYGLTHRYLLSLSLAMRCQSPFVFKFDAVAPLTLCAVQSRICAGNQIAEIGRSRGADAGDSETGSCTKSALANSELLGRKLLADAFNCNRRIFLFHMCNDHQKFLASKASANV